MDEKKGAGEEVEGGKRRVLKREFVMLARLRKRVCKTIKISKYRGNYTTAQLVENVWREDPNEIYLAPESVIMSQRE